MTKRAVWLSFVLKLCFHFENDLLYLLLLTITMKTFKIFIVEDDPWYMDILEYHLLLNPEYEVEKYETGKDCLNNLYKRPSAVTLDYSLPDMKGKEVLKKIVELSPETSVIIISGQEDITTAVELLKEGAYDYIVKDEDTKIAYGIHSGILKKTTSLNRKTLSLRRRLGKNMSSRRSW